MSLSFEASILHLIPDALIWVRPVINNGTIEDFEVGYANKAADLGINHPKGSLMGLRILQDGVPSTASAPGNFQHFFDVYQSGTVKEYTFVAHHSNRVYETIRQPHEGGVLSLTRDRKAQREAEQKEKETRHMLESIVRNSPNGIIFYNALRDEKGETTDFTIRYFNDRCHELTGITKEQRETLTFRQILHLLGSESAIDHYIKVVETGIPFQREQYIAKLQKWIVASIVKLDDGFLALLSDITALKQVEDQIQQVALRFETVVNTSQAGMFTLLPVTDHQGEVTDFRFGIVNQAVAAYIGQTAEVLRGSLASVYFPAYKSNGLFAIYKSCYLKGTPSNFDFHYEDGYDVFFNINVLKMGDEVLVTFTDHTTLKRLQIELEKKVDELRRSNASLEEFAHAASHDLKEPMRKVQTFAGRLKASLEARLTEQEVAYFDRMERAAERMYLLVEDLLQYSQMSLKPMEKQEVNLSDQIKAVLSDLEVAIEEKQATVNVGALPTVKGYGRQLQQLFQNLISNALKYSKSAVPPIVEITASRITAGEMPLMLSSEPADTPFYLISVTDNGIGFEQQYADRIFQMFQRLHGRSEYAGTGVGLSIVKKVVENHSGYITAEGRPDEGATFKIYLPA